MCAHWHFSLNLNTMFKSIKSIMQIFYKKWIILYIIRAHFIAIAFFPPKYAHSKWNNVIDPHARVYMYTPLMPLTYSVTTVSLIKKECSYESEECKY